MYGDGETVFHDVQARDVHYLCRDCLLLLIRFSNLDSSVISTASHSDQTTVQNQNPETFGLSFVISRDLVIVVSRDGGLPTFTTSIPTSRYWKPSSVLEGGAIRQHVDQTIRPS